MVIACNRAAQIFVVYGDYDRVTDDAGAAALLAKFSGSPLNPRNLSGC